jgi:hypothetical protein
MSTISEYFEYARLADAAYVNLSTVTWSIPAAVANQAVSDQKLPRKLADATFNTSANGRQRGQRRIVFWSNDLTMPRRTRVHLDGLPLHIVQGGHHRTPCFFAEEDFHTYLHWLGEALKKAEPVALRSASRAQRRPATGPCCAPARNPPDRPRGPSRARPRSGSAAAP